MVHLIRSPEYHPSLLHHSLNSYYFKFTAPYTSLKLTLGFMEHTVNAHYLLLSIANNSPATCVLLVNSGGLLWRDFLACAHRYSVLPVILAGISQARIIEAKKMYTRDDNITHYNKVHLLIDKELTHRQINQ